MNCWQFKLDQIHDYAYYEKAFSEEECKKIIKLGKRNLKKAETIKAKQTKKFRESRIQWLFPTEENSWIYRKLTDLVISLNNDFFKFDLDGFLEALQFTNYSSKIKNSRYDKHVDRMYNFNIRKLSVSLQLNKSKDYEGGDLNLYYNNNPIKMLREQGTLIVFPSYTLHEVTPITKGERNSLVAWVSGKQFK
jgi:PKHD-type hydroxylase